MFLLVCQNFYYSNMLLLGKINPETNNFAEPFLAIFEDSEDILSDCS